MEESQSKLSRRTLFAGAGTIGAAVAAGKLLPGVQPAVVLPDVQPAPEKGGGYQLTEHVKRYYQSTRT